MKTKLTNNLLDMVQVNNGLKRYLVSLTERKPFTERSWAWDGTHSKKLDPDQVLDAWMEELASLENGNNFEKMVYQFDISQKSKWGPQGGHAPISDLLDEIVLPTFEYGEASSKPSVFESPEWKEAKSRFLKRLKDAGVQALRPASYEKVTVDMRTRDTLESNSGFPDFTTRKKPEVLKRAIDDAYNGNWKEYPAVALFRTYNGKTRLVWMFPMAANLVEGSYYQPLFSSIMRSQLANTLFCPWRGFEAVRSRITDTYATGAVVAASDFTSTDAHFQWAQTEEVADVIEQCFQYKYRAGLRESLRAMHEIPLVIGPEDMLVGSHGVSSGSNWTNFVETIFDGIFGEYVNIITENKWSLLYAIGDDAAWVAQTEDETFAETLARLGESVGMLIKQEKTMNERDRVKTLQRLFQREYFQSEASTLRGVYSTIRALKSIVYPERFHNPKKWNKDMFAARTFMILENCVDHPLIYQFVKFVLSSHRYLSEFANKTDTNLNQLQEKAKLLPGLNPTYNQEKRDSSLSEFATIKIARQISQTESRLLSV